MTARAAALFALFFFAACKQPTDLGNECSMTKRDPNVDGGRLFIKEGEIKVGANKDFISFGATDCENLVCVIDTDAPAGTDPNAPAVGYCSNRCPQGTECPSGDPADDLDPKKKLRCRALVLDEETLRSVNIGDLKSPYFCARGAVTDGGTPRN